MDTFAPPWCPPPGPRPALTRGLPFCYHPAKTNRENSAAFVRTLVNSQPVPTAQNPRPVRLRPACQKLTRYQGSTGADGTASNGKINILAIPANTASIPVSSRSRARERGYLRTGNPLVNRLVSNTLWGGGSRQAGNWSRRSGGSRRRR
ncbi:MAG: hypothetical protein ACI4QD_05050 [Kiritimatiellia bacterium]